MGRIECMENTKRATYKTGLTGYCKNKTCYIGYYKKQEGTPVRTICLVRVCDENLSGFLWIQLDYQFLPFNSSLLVFLSVLDSIVVPDFIISAFGATQKVLFVVLVDCFLGYSNFFVLFLLSELFPFSVNKLSILLSSNPILIFQESLLQKVFSR